MAEIATPGAVPIKANEQVATTTDASATVAARMEAFPLSRWHLKARVIVGSATFFDAVDTVAIGLRYRAAHEGRSLSVRSLIPSGGGVKRKRQPCDAPNRRTRLAVGLSTWGGHHGTMDATVSPGGATALGEGLPTPPSRRCVGLPRTWRPSVRPVARSGDRPQRVGVTRKKDRMLLAS